ncbi:MAG: porin [Cyclobacteriaceae bacterium]|nr:porin [Cyclobacteriaceae bacterium]
MKKLALLFSLFILSVMPIMAQDEVVVVEEEETEGGLSISGSVDTYFKYDFSGYENIPTSFANEQNSVSLGMIDLVLEQTVGKASFVGEISFGPRNEQSVYGFNIQNLYVSYALTDKLSLTGGYMGTFVGYEVISPAGNFNYSTSYLFTNGPFQNAGIKADYAFSDRVALMVGLFNDWNVTQDMNGVSDLGAQLYVAPVIGWDVYLNVITGSRDFDGSVGSTTEFDITTGYQITDAFYLGLNFAKAISKLKDSDDEAGFTGLALYPQYAFNDAVALGMRYENFTWKDGTNYNSFTFTLPIKSGPLTFIPEFRLDTADEDEFLDKDMQLTGSASQFLLAAVYAF